ncbi:oligopeptide ABC transporter permease [Natranaerobius thermophilus]|uniref:Binding-protein-dependent transport systems inner membrane component n=1 Tax=Natranaerobius thermophilus (strain ATCC BAA-1301 / DSM 18059 / JW/NM-WN-LF) TaxID=457570 RepID=B2A5R2_NATTJ|nr:oligopeptide ABC transporter permease [Natranaerobius thermophilus]ACB84075.1 binding-protein-dependent transport systems inner membrane component [Natranaerobius thermophilus JW/NM-WN-LF]
MAKNELNESTSQEVQSHGLSEEVESPIKLIWRRFKRNRLALIGLIVLLILVFGAVFAPFLTPHDRDTIDYANADAEPDSEHILGTDDRGRDMFTRLLYAGRVSLSVGIFATLLRILIGVTLGGIAGYYGGAVDNVIMRIADVFMSFPFLPIALTFVAILGPSIYNIMLVIAIIGWPGICRIVRAEILSLREQEFIEAAKALGLSDRTQIIKHLIPNTMAPIIVSATLGIAGAILTESFLSYLGLGVSPPTPTWGNLLSAAQESYIIRNRWWQWVPPGIMIFLAVMSLNLLGDGLRDALDPKLKE